MSLQFSSSLKNLSISAGFHVSNFLTTLRFRLRISFSASAHSPPDETGVAGFFAGTVFAGEDGVAAKAAGTSKFDEKQNAQSAKTIFGAYFTRKIFLKNLPASK